MALYLKKYVKDCEKISLFTQTTCILIKNVSMKSLILSILCILALSSCTPSQSQNHNDNISWPEYLREWAAQYDITDTRHVAIIREFDILYRLIDERTEVSEKLCDLLCNLKDTISYVIVNDTTSEFPLMMRATVNNMFGVIYNNPWLHENKYSCNILEYCTVGSRWWTTSNKEFDFMYTTFIGQSWVVPYRFADMSLAKDDENESVMVFMTINNYIDYLERWKVTLPDMSEINFDNNAEAVFEEIKDLSPIIYRKLLQNEDVIQQIFPIIFPDNKVLNMLCNYFMSKHEPVYHSLARYVTMCV